MARPAKEVLVEYYNRAIWWHLIESAGMPLEDELEACTLWVERAPYEPEPWHRLSLVLCDECGGERGRLHELVGAWGEQRAVLFDRLFYGQPLASRMRSPPLRVLLGAVLLFLHFPCGRGEALEELLRHLVANCRPTVQPQEQERTMSETLPLTFVRGRLERAMGAGAERISSQPLFTEALVRVPGAEALLFSSTP